jgi:hypothetical protein
MFWFQFSFFVGEDEDSDLFGKISALEQKHFKLF